MTPRHHLELPLTKKIIYNFYEHKGCVFAVYQTVIDYDVPLADYSPTFVGLEERVAAALMALHVTDSVPDADSISDEQKNSARAIFTGKSVASDDDLADPGVVAHLSALLSEYDRVVVKSAAQLRTYITNKLLLETADRDPRIRLKALEMLGKISDVGLFTEKTEITMRHRPTEELEQLLRERLTKVIEGEIVERHVEPPKELEVSDVLASITTPAPKKSNALFR